MECGVHTMKQIRIDWNRHLPLGMDGTKTKQRMSLALGIGIGGSFRFLMRYFSARGSLYGYVNGKHQRIANRFMLPFVELLQGSFTFMAIVALGFALSTAIFYLYHYQGCRSIYTMKRLPNRWELWRRCFTVPAAFVILSGITTMILIGLYWLLWRFATPVDAFPM